MIEETIGTRFGDSDYLIKPTEAGTDTEVTGAIRGANEGRGRFDLIPPEALEMLAKHYEAGLEHYPEGNWRKGISLKRYMNSAMRHINKYRLGHRDEPHLVSALWNIIGFLVTEEMISVGLVPEELDDLPKGIYFPGEKNDK